MSAYDRQTGRTTRLMWRALIAASEKPAQRIAFVIAHANARHWAFDRLVSLCPLFPNAKARCGDFTLVLPNDSTITVESLEQTYGPRGRGREWHGIFLDHYVPMEAWPHDTHYPRIIGAEEPKAKPKSPGMQALEDAAEVQRLTKRIEDFLAARPELDNRPAAEKAKEDFRAFRSEYAGTSFFGIDWAKGRDTSALRERFKNVPRGSGAWQATWTTLCDHMEPSRVTMAQIDAERLSPEEVERLRELEARFKVWKKTGPHDPPCFFHVNDEEEMRQLRARRAHVERMLIRWREQGAA